MDKRSQNLLGGFSNVRIDWQGMEIESYIGSMEFQCWVYNFIWL